MRARQSSIATNPVLIGAATVLVVVVAMFLSYNANRGLPFVPTYTVTIESTTAANLVRGNDVRIGGARVGVVDSIKVRRNDDGTNTALLALKMEKAVDPLPKDSTFIIRPRSALGLKYVEITRGKSDEGYSDGDLAKLEQMTPEQVEFDEVANMFDEETRRANQLSLEGFGNAIAGRGSSINQAIGAFRPLLRDAVPVLRNLSDPDTHLTRFFSELGDAAAIVAPAAEAQAELFVNLDTTFSALNTVKPEIQESIEEGPATLDNAIENFPVIRPFLANTQALFRELRPGVRSLRGAAPDLADALDIGTPVLRRSVELNRRLEPLLQALADFAQDPMVPRGVRKLTDAAASLNPTLQFLAPAQTVCNYGTLWFRNVSSLLSEGDANGTWQRFIIVATPPGPNNEGGPSDAPANGPNAPNFLHTNPYPLTAAPGQSRECEAGNEPFNPNAQAIGNPPSKEPARTEGTP
jgi:virulence factor Mce-like protein